MSFNFLCLFRSVGRSQVLHIFPSSAPALGAPALRLSIYHSISERFIRSPAHCPANDDEVDRNHRFVRSAARAQRGPNDVSPSLFRLPPSPAAAAARAVTPSGAHFSGAVLIISALVPSANHLNLRSSVSCGCSGDVGKYAQPMRR